MPSMTSVKRKAAVAARHSLPNAAPSNPRSAQPQSTPTATNKRPKRHSTATPAADTRQLKAAKTQHSPLFNEQDERREAEEGKDVDAALTALCAVITSLAAALSHSSSSDSATLLSEHQAILAALHRLSPPVSLSPHLPPSAAVLSAIRSAAERLAGIARSLHTDSPFNSLVATRLQQLQSTTLPLSSSDTYAILLSASTALCQLLPRSAASHHSSAQADDASGTELSGRYVERVTGLFGSELDALRKEGESSVGAACLPLLAQSMQNIIVAHLPTDGAHGTERALLLADLQRWDTAQVI